MRDKINKPKPPKLAKRFLQFFLKKDLLEEVEGDLEEQFFAKVEDYSLGKAKRNYYYQVVNYLRPFAIKKIKTISFNPTIMLKHNFLISWRSLLNNKTFALINIGGLTLGMVVTILTSLWLYDEITYDKFHENYEDIYQVIANRDFGGNIFTDRNMTFGMARSVKEISPQVEKAVWATYAQELLMTHNIKAIKNIGYQVGGPFFDLFSFKSLEGDPSIAVNDPTAIIITESMAKAHFGDEDPMGKTLQINNDETRIVKAVLADPPRKSSFMFDFIYPFELSNADVSEQLDNWDSHSWNVFVQLQSYVDLTTFEAGITDLYSKRTETDMNTHFAFPMKKWHLQGEFNNGINEGGLIEKVKLFGVLALIVLFIACINFMNLSTARSEKRVKEVAVRKTLGTNRGQLIYQFFTESFVISSLAFIVAIGASFVLMPSFNNLVDKSLVLPLGNLVWWALGLGIVLFTTTVAGGYPALYLSSFSPIGGLQARKTKSKNVDFSKRLLLVFQFVASIVLISATILVHQQVQFVKNIDIGYDPNNLIMITSSPQTDENYEVIKDRLLSAGFVASTSRTMSPITQVWNRFPAPEWPGKSPETNVLFSGTWTDGDFVKTMDTKLLLGREFSGSPADSSSVLINQTVVDIMGIDDPIGVELRRNQNKYTVIGVIDNISMDSPYSAAAPLMITYNNESSNFIHVRLKEGAKIQDAISDMGVLFAEMNPAFPFEYKFVDEEFGRKFEQEVLINKIINILAFIAIFICCIGLLGMATFILESRRKEMAIRKVLGSSILQMLGLVSKEFVILVAVALLIATPVSFFWADNWLQNYEYRVSISLWLYALVGGLVLLLTFTIIGFKTVMAGIKNPIGALRQVG